MVRELPSKQRVQDAFDREAAGAQVPALRVTAVVRLPQGHSNDTFVVEVEDPAGLDAPRRYVVRRDIVHGITEPYDIPKEYRLLKALEKSAVAVPRVLWLQPDAAEFGAPYYVMEFCRGTVADELYLSGDMSGLIGRDTVDGRRAKHRAYIRELAAIHSVDWRGSGLEEMARPAGFDFDGAPTDGTCEGAERALDEWETRARRESVVAEPLLEEPLCWMRENIPAVPHNVLLHGDCKLSNYMFDGDIVSGVLDWEWARIGDPMNDLAWALPKPGTSLPEGFLDFDECCAEYESASGHRVDQARLEFYHGIADLKIYTFAAAMGRLTRAGLTLDVRYPCLGGTYARPAAINFNTRFAGKLDGEPHRANSGV